MKYRFNKWWAVGIGILDFVATFLMAMVVGWIDKKFFNEKLPAWVCLPVICLFSLFAWFLAGYWAEKSLIEEDEQKKKKTE